MPARILLGVSGSIAAYKACELVRILRDDGHEIRVAMTPAAEAFVGAQTFEALSGAPVVRSSTENPVRSAMASEAAVAPAGSRITHTELAAWADLLVVAPAAADLLAKMADGRGDDAVALLHLAFAAERPRLVAPAMNVEMWRSPAVRRAVGLLSDSGVRFVGPDAGDLACGAVGPGRMAEPDEIAAAARSLLAPRDLEGKRVLILSGPTRERLDAVRYITNASSGRMGRALAEAARARGAAEVVVVTGPAEILPAYGTRVVAVESAAEMLAAAAPEAARADLVIGAAAVADFAFVNRSKKKIARADLPPALAIEPTPDVLGTLCAARREGQIFVGFAAEYEEDTAKAERERAARGLDLVVWNRVPAAIGGSRAEAAILSADGAESIGLLPKEEIASRLLSRAALLLRATSRPSRSR